MTPASTATRLSHALPGECVADDVLSAVSWSHEAGPFDAMGYRFRIRATDAALGRHVAALYASLAVAGDGGNGACVSLVDLGAAHEARYLLFEGTELVRRRTHAWLQLASLLALVNRKATWTASRHGTVMHAAGVAANGRAVLLPGHSGAGKTTLATCLVRCGMDYLSDEAIVLAPDGTRAGGYAKALSLEPGTQAIFPDLAPPVADDVATYTGDDWQVPPDAVRAGAVVDTARPVLMIAPRFDAGVVRTTLEPIGRARMVERTAANSFHFADHPIRDLETLAATARRCATFLVTYADVRDACRTVRSLLDDDHA